MNTIQAYVETHNLVMRTNRRITEAVGVALRKNKIYLSPSQAILIHHIGNQRLRGAELKSFEIYIGSNPSYTLNKLEAHGYLIREKYSEDRRGTVIVLTEKGLTIQRHVEEAYKHQLFKIEIDLVALNTTLHQLYNNTGSFLP